MTLPSKQDNCLAKAEGAAQSYHCHCEGRRPVAIRTPLRCGAPTSPAGAGKRTDCHVASLLAMTEVDGTLETNILENTR